MAKTPMQFIQQIAAAIPTLLASFPLTVALTIISAILGLGFAVLLVIVQVRHIPVLAQLATVLISFVRSNPTIISLMLIYYGLPMLLQPIGININGLPIAVFSIVILSLCNACSISEMIRGGYLSVDHEQEAAGLSIGMSRFQVFRRITVPEVTAVALPGYVNEFIGLFSDTSILFTIGMIDMMSRAQILISNDYGINKTPVYVAVALIYWAGTVLITHLFRRFENRRLTHEGGGPHVQHQ